MNLALILCLGVVSSCTWFKTKPPSPEPQGMPLSDKISTKVQDRLQLAYQYFAMASLHMANGQNKEAQDFLNKALENDPDSIYLNKKMSILLKGMKNYPEAAKYAQKCIDRDPEDIGTRILLAEIFSASGDEKSAEKEHKKILELDPNQHRVRLILTTALIRKGQFKPALAHLDRLIQKGQNLVIAHYYRGRIQLELKNYPEAEKAYLDALKLNKRMEPALFDLGSLYQMREMYDKALKIYEKLLSFYPNNLVVRERLINIHYKLGQEEKAEKQMEEIKKQSKPGDPGRQTLGLIYLKHGKLDESIEELNLIVSAWPEDHKSRYYLASAYEEKGEVEKALDHFRLIKKGSKYFINAQMHISYILDNQKKYDEAIDVLKKAIEVDKKKTELYLMLASIFETRKEYGKAIEVLEEGLIQDDKTIELIFRLGVVLDKSGDKEKSLEQMRRILEINKDHADALNYIGYTYAEQGIRLNEAMELIQKALKIKPNSGYIIDSLGWVYYQKGMYDDALNSLEKAVSLTPNDPTITEHLGDVYFKKKKYKKSLEMYQKAISLKHPDKEKLKKKIEEVEKVLK